MAGLNGCPFRRHRLLDTVTPIGRRETTRIKMEAAQSIMMRAASAAVIKGDPLAGQLEAVSIYLAALTELYEASEDTQIDIAHTFRSQTDKVTEGAIEKVQAFGASIVDRLVPRLVEVTERTMKQRIWMMRLRTVLWASATLTTFTIVIVCLSYGTGFRAGQVQGEIAGKTINAAMAAGPGAATAWAGLMALNDPVSALAECKKSISSDSEGRRSCPMPIWLDPFPREYGG
jgi:hypothetical protein